MTTPNKNGNGAAAVAPEKTTAIAVVKELQAPKADKTKGEADDKMPLEDRLYRLAQLFELQKKYDRLRASLQRLNEFELKGDGERSGLRLYDDNRNEFSTSNPEILVELKEFLKLKIAEKIKAIEPKLVW